MKMPKSQVENIVLRAMHEVADAKGRNVLRPVIRQLDEAREPVARAHEPIVVGEPARPQGKALLVAYEKIHGPIIVGSVLRSQKARDQYVLELTKHIDFGRSTIKLSGEHSLSQLVNMVHPKCKKV